MSGVIVKSNRSHAVSLQGMEIKPQPCDVAARHGDQTADMRCRCRAWRSNRRHAMSLQGMEIKPQPCDVTARHGVKYNKNNCLSQPDNRENEEDYLENEEK